ncbi:hypothetical protein ACFVYJ_08050 [Pontibacter sp. JAM-7]|uniref:hypothetical protein n=1 Tax=Pontibacter sp. JAM-7 TaxID=3366581 RepID=UPI003AF678F3
MLPIRALVSLPYFLTACLTGWLAMSPLWAAEPEVDSVPTELPDNQEELKDGLPPLEAFEGMVERPLFHATRRPKAVQEEASGSDAELLETWKLTGVVFDDAGDPVALFKQRNGEERRRLTQGMPLDSGWDVALIAVNHVVVGNDDEEVRFDLWEPRPVVPVEPPKNRRQIVREAPDEKLDEQENQPDSRSTGDKQ